MCTDVIIPIRQNTKISKLVGKQNVKYPSAYLVIKKLSIGTHYYMVKWKNQAIDHTFIQAVDEWSWGLDNSCFFREMSKVRFVDGFTVGSPNCLYCQLPVVNYGLKTTNGELQK